MPAFVKIRDIRLTLAVKNLQEKHDEKIRGLKNKTMTRIAREEELEELKDDFENKKNNALEKAMRKEIKTQEKNTHKLRNNLLPLANRVALSSSELSQTSMSNIDNDNRSDTPIAQIKEEDDQKQEVIDDDDILLEKTEGGGDLNLENRQDDNLVVSVPDELKPQKKKPYSIMDSLMMKIGVVAPEKEESPPPISQDG